MATILAHIQVEAGREGDFEAIVRSLFAETHAKESGVLHYEYWRGAEPGLYYCLLAFDHFHTFLAHQTSAHHEAASPRLGEVIRDIRLEWLDPVSGASPLPMTEMQSLPDNADELTRRYHKIFAAKIQDWWRSRR